MTLSSSLPKQHSLTLQYQDEALEHEFKASYDASIRLPLLQGIIISILSWFSALGLIYYIIPEEAYWLVPLTIGVIGSYFGFIVYVAATKRMQGSYHVLGAISNAWAGLYAIFYCHQFPNGEHLTLPVLIFILFFGSYMVRLRWLAGSIAALTYTISYSVYLVMYSGLESGQIALYFFVIWMTFIFAVIAGRMVETNSRITFYQQRIIAEQNEVIEHEKQILLREVHHRVKNNLQVIISLINLELSKPHRIQNTETLQKIQGRILSMSLVHLWMKQSSDFEKLSVKQYVNDLISSIKNFRQPATPVRVTLDIPEELLVGLETGTPLGILLTEIITNFFDHVSALPEAAFTLSVQLGEDGKFHLQYKDNGPGYPDSLESTIEETLGLELIELLTEQLDGEVTFRNENGAVCEVTFVG